MVLLLDVSSLPGGKVYTDNRGKEVDFGDIFDDQLRPVIKHMMTIGLIKETESFGFAMAEPDTPYISRKWNDPHELVWMTAGWGPKKDLYVANAVRKLRLAARVGGDSIGVHARDIDTPVKSQEPDGTFAWGDFPHGGAVLDSNPFISGVVLLGAVSALTAQEDDAIASMILQVFGLEIYKANRVS
jgi:hypothetical protein